MQIYREGDVLKKRRHPQGMWRVTRVKKGNIAIFITGTRPEFVCGCVYEMWNEDLGVEMIASENNPVLDDFIFVKRESVHG